MKAATLFSRALLVLALAGASLCGCKVKKQGEGADKKVDIETPVGSLHVNTQVDPKDTGLEVYPGAVRAEDEEKKHAANLSLDSSVAGVKVVAIKFRSDDPPEKLLDFYRKQLKAFGEVFECHGSFSFVHGDRHCSQSIVGNETNLVSGTEDRHRIVSLKSEGKGSSFALIYVQIRGERGTQ